MSAETFSTLHSFTGGTGGALPCAVLTLSGNTIYGTTASGGENSTDNGSGIIFAVNLDETGFTNLHSFVGAGAGGGVSGQPGPGLVLAGTTLYGTTTGAVFSMNTDGTGFTNLYSFNLNSNQINPTSGLVLSGSTLYGSVFSVNTDGSNFQLLQKIPLYTTANPLLLSGSTLYWSTAGYTEIVGTISAVNTDGSGFTNLYTFYSGSNTFGPYGSYPSGQLAISGNTLYGTTQAGGTNLNGTVFAINTDGTGFTNLYSFTGGIDGGSPVGGVILSGNTLYGTTYYGGGAGYHGTVFAVNTDGTGFQVLHSFTGGAGGETPNAGLILSNNTLYGTTEFGGVSNSGTLFSIALNDREVQTINFPSITNQTYSTSPLLITLPLSSSGLPVSTSIDGPATLSNDAITMEGTGTVTLIASQAGDSNYLVATPVTNSFVISQAPQDLTFPTLSDASVGCTPINLAATDDNGLPVTYSVISGPATISNNTLIFSEAGTVTLGATQSGNSDYLASTSTVTFTVAPALGTQHQSIRFPQPRPERYSPGATILLTATAPGGIISYTSSDTNLISVTNSTATLNGAGKAVITANQYGNNFFSAATPVSRTVTITKASQDITFPEISRQTYGALPFTISSPESTSGLDVLVTVRSGPATFTNNILTINGAGEVTLTATQSGNSSYLAAPPKTNVVLVDKAPQTISFAPASPISFVSGATFPLTATTQSGLSVHYESSNPKVISVSGATATIKGKGSVTLTAFQDGNSNWKAAKPVSISLVVSNNPAN